MLITSTNFVDDGTITDHTAEQDSTYTKAENIQTMQLAESYVANSASAAYLEIDFGQSRIIDTVAVLGHNLVQSGSTIRVRLSTVSDFATTVYDSTAVAAWPTVEEFGYLAYGEFHWGGILSSEAAVDYTISFFKVLSQAVQARYMRVDLAVSPAQTNNIEVGRVFAGPSYRPTNNMAYGWSIGWVDDSVVTKSRSGNVFIDERPRYRRLSFDLVALPEDEIFHNVFNHLDRRKGIAGDIIVMPQDEDETTYITQNIYGRLLETSPIQSRTLSYYGRNIQVEEII